VNVSVNEDVNGYPASANESGSVRLNASVSRFGNECVNG